MWISVKAKYKFLGIDHQRVMDSYSDVQEEVMATSIDFGALRRADAASSQYPPHNEQAPRIVEQPSPRPTPMEQQSRHPPMPPPAVQATDTLSKVYKKVSVEGKSLAILGAISLLVLTYSGKLPMVSEMASPQRQQAQALIIVALYTIFTAHLLS